MKTTDSVMRENEIELLEKTLEYIMAESSREPDGEKLWVKTSYELADICRPIISHSLAEARREWVEEMRKDLQISEEILGEGGTVGILSSQRLRAFIDTQEKLNSYFDLLTGDSPERKA